MTKKFTARCRLPELVPVQDVTAEQEAARQEAGIRAATATKHKGEWCAQVPHDLEFTDTALFETHMRKVHGKTKISGTPKVRMWKAPKTTEEGTDFAPVGLEPGAEVTWTQPVPTGETVVRRRFDHAENRDIPFDVPVMRPTVRTGQVWSGAASPRSAWVIPTELLEDELAVQVRLDKASDDGAVEYVTSCLAGGRVRGAVDGPFELEEAAS